MRGQMIVACLCTLSSMGLLVIILGQNQALTLMNKGKEKMPMEIKRLDDQLSDLDPMNISVEKLLTQGENLVKDLEATVATLGPTMEKMRTEIDVCEGTTKILADELAVLEKDRTETEAILKPEADAWKLEINNLRAQAVGYRPICDHLNNSDIAVKFCGTKGQPIK